VYYFYFVIYFCTVQRVTDSKTGSDVEDIKRVLSAPDVSYRINADDSGNIEVITWTTNEQLQMLRQLPEVVMMDGTYRVCIYSLHTTHRGT